MQARHADEQKESTMRTTSVYTGGVEVERVDRRLGPLR